MHLKYQFLLVCCCSFRKLYYTVWIRNDKHNPAVYEANLDGSGSRLFFDDGLYWPYAVAVDYVENKLYWGDAIVHAIWYADLDGSNVEVI